MSSRARLFNTAHASGGGGANALADWVTRSTEGGVTHKQRWTTTGDVTGNSAVYPDPPVGRVTLDATDGIIGDGCLKIDVPSTDDASSGAWRCTLNDAWTTDGQGFGSTDFYVQYRVKLGPNRLTPSNGGGGFKFMILSEWQPQHPADSRSHPNFEIVCNNELWRGVFDMYRDGGAANFSRTDGAGIHIQSALDNGAGISDPELRYCLYPNCTGCWAFVEQQWFTVYLHIKIPSYGGSTGNTMDCYVARQGETSYTQLFHNTGFTIGSDGALPNGINGIWLLPYDTNRTNASYSTWHKYDQLIVSYNPIACPLY